MTTKLEGKATRFLPFNRGNEGAAGNPPNPDGFATAYLWEDVWARDSWLEILGRYLIGKRDDKKRLTTVIFPRYHQLDATRKLVADVLAKRARAALPDPAFGRIGQDQFHCLERAFPGRPA